MGIYRWRKLVEAGFAMAAVTTALLAGGASAGADSPAGAAADTGVSNTADAKTDQDAPAEAAKPSSTAEPEGGVDEPEDSSAATTSGEKPDTENPDTDKADAENAAEPEDVFEEAVSPTLSVIPTEVRRDAHDATVSSGDTPAVAPPAQTESADDDADRPSGAGAAPSVEPAATAHNDSGVAAVPAASGVQTVALRTESAPAEPVSMYEAVAVPVTGAADSVAAGSHQPSLLTVIGSLVMNVVIGLIQLIDGPPVVPPGSTVTVRTSSLTLPIGNGTIVDADWYIPEVIDASTHLVYLQHGFLATGPMYSYTAAHLAERTNSIVVAPSLSSNFFDPDAAWVGGSTMQKAIAQLFAGDRQALTESASAAAGYAITLPQNFVLVGHSAGGTLVTAAAGWMVQNGAIADLKGVVMLDGVEPAGSHLVGDALAKLTGDNDVPIYLVSSQRYMWNRHGDMADKLMAARPGAFNGVALTDGAHIDYMEGGNFLLQFSEYLVSGFSHRENIDAAGIITAGWVNDMFGCTTSNGVYGAAGQNISIATPTKPATAVVLPLGPAGPSPLGADLDKLLSDVFEYAGLNLFVYEPLA